LGPVPWWQKPLFDDFRFNPLVQFAAPKQAASSEDQLPFAATVEAGAIVFLHVRIFNRWLLFDGRHNRTHWNSFMLTHGQVSSAR
jgi:hypothetical protein